ncbi:MAG: ribonuclease P protein component [Verrucomicrobia bacterium]|nr:MAG: ribonuclease P protein component [Verrucomicrobiota bacterium]
MSHGSASPDEGLPAARRLRATGLFAEAYAQDRCCRGRHLLLWTRRGAGAALRVGVVTSRKVGGAVQRAKARRRLREVFRRHRAELHGEVDLVMVARASLVEAPWAEVVSDFLRVVDKAGLRAATTESKT